MYALRQTTRRFFFNAFIQLSILFSILFVLHSCSKTEPTNVSKTDSSHVDLLAKYPTTLSKGDTKPSNARKWLFTPQDIYHIDSFQFQYNDLDIQTKGAALGLGHSKDGVVWAVVVPDDPGTLTSDQSTEPETIEHIWIRLHPKQLARLFPPDRVNVSQNSDAYSLIKRVAEFKFRNSYHAGQLAMIPEPSCFVFDIDTDSIRRFFHVDEDKDKIDYSHKMANWILPKPVTLDAAMAKDIFDQVWTEFDKTYAMFAIKPDVDWEATRREYSLSVEKVKTKAELVDLLSQMLGRLKDEHIWITVDGKTISTFKRNVRTNGNPKAYPN
ncbi:hypothetical protein K8I31_07805, partial [bacterium]|nr:hypothetical protein [bacterium]